MAFSQYTKKDIQRTFKDLEVSENGLSEKEAAKRLKKYGLNELKGKEVGPLDVFLRQFKSPFFYLLLIAAIAALFVGEKIDGIVILIFVLVNVTLGFFQEFRAEKAIALLKKYVPLKIKVLRDGQEEIIDRGFLVPGDIVLLKAGNIIPADLRILKVNNFLVDESVLTGESVPVTKRPEAHSKEIKEIFEAKNILFGGSLVVSGKAEGIVIGTGKDTVLGEITELVSEVSHIGIYEKDLLYFSRLILRIVVLTIALIFLANIIIHGTTNLLIFLIFCVALIVSILPEALPAVVTFSLSKGALKLAREKAIVRRLSAVEDLGNIEILCLDKTGTITENKLYLGKVFSSDKDKCLLYGLLVSSCEKEEIESSLNPFDVALWKKSSMTIRDSLKDFKLVSEFPFDSFQMRAGVLVENKNSEQIFISEGAPEVILGLSSYFLDNLKREEIQKEIEKEGVKGNRVLAVAFKKTNKKNFSEKNEKGLTFLGYFSFQDPLKDTAEEAIKLAEQLGVKIKIITGDSKEVSGFIGEKIGLIDEPKNVILGGELESLAEEKFDDACQKFSIFARISPSTKYKIIKSLQKKYEVGFMGEGINDVPALKVANVGIVVQEAADAAREASDVVLLQKDLRAVVNGIKHGRAIFSNINKYIKCALASNFGNFYSIAVISLFVPFLPMLPIQILLGNLLSDFPLISIATDHIDIEELKRPRLYQLNKVLPLIISLALVSTIFDFIFFAIFYKSQPAIIQTLWFIESILTEILLIFSIRTRHFFLKAKRPSFYLIFFTIVDAAIIVLLPFTNLGQEFFHFVSPPISFVFIVFFLLINYFIVSEIVKLIYFRYRKSLSR